ncbi:MAG: hypothetical protein JSS83_10125 [Cyanobacteria bacterium SZAS LIN-3]|nr:hypothetical protein [Cyanobacteria bacterium SZAS LIN-3]MBS2009256.1 hypothetical protein [Cyanobacteria bacterium SZAS TMP-1]
MLEVNGTLIVMVLSFLVFMKLLDIVYITPVAKVLSAREAKIEQDLAASRKFREEADGVLGQYEVRLADVRTRAQAAINDAVGEAQKVRSAEIAKVQAEGRTRIEAARAALAKEKTELIGELVESEVLIVDSIMKKLIGSAAGSSLDRSVVKKALEEAC